MKAAPVFDALTALQLALSANTYIPPALRMKLLHAEVGLRQALKDAGLELPVEVQGVEA